MKHEPEPVVPAAISPVTPASAVTPASSAGHLDLIYRTFHVPEPEQEPSAEARARVESVKRAQSALAESMKPARVKS